jgi:hypothetical protein
VRGREPRRGSEGSRRAADVASNHIYWTNRGPQAICADIDGTGVDLSYIPLAAEPFGITVDGYWTNNAHGFEDGRVGRAELDGGNVDEAFIAGPLGEYMGRSPPNSAPSRRYRPRRSSSARRLHDHGPATGPLRPIFTKRSFKTRIARA